jgi:type IV pilus assembly protein PilO
MSAFRLAKPASGVTLKERIGTLLTPLNLHIAGVAVLGLVNLYLVAHMLYAWNAASSQNAAAIAQQRIALKTAEISAKPLQGLDVKLANASEDADAFYKDRLPVSYSEVAGELGALATNDKVKLTRVQYAQAPVLGDSAAALTEVRMDASLSGDYRPLMLFINSLERDKRFFLIGGIALTGGQAGTVNLRVSLTTYIRGLRSEEEMKKAEVGADEAPAATPAKEGAR